MYKNNERLVIQVDKAIDCINKIHVSQDVNRDDELEALLHIITRVIFTMNLVLLGKH